MAAPEVHTYHCLCTSLLLASTHHLTSLPRRAAPSLDNAIILPIPPPPHLSISSPSASDSEDDGNVAPESSTRGSRQAKSDQLPELGYTLLLSTTLDRRSTVVRRSDGFEKRYLLRCGRCGLAVGYELDGSHYAESRKDLSSVMDVDGDNEGDSKDKERTKIVYILPGGVVSTEVMAAGKKMTEQEVILGGEEQKLVAAWE